MSKLKPHSQEIARLYSEEGWVLREIAEHYSAACQSVATILENEGIKRKPRGWNTVNYRYLHTPEARAKSLAKQLANSPWTPEREAHLLQLIRKGRTYSQAARAMGISRGAVSGRLRMIRERSQRESIAA